MAAKRLGEALSEIQGTSKQLLRVKTDESGFEFVDPATIPSYTITNSATDRTMNADETTIDELADVLSTLIADLDAAGLTGGAGGLEAFQWSTSEQVWPFEKDLNGNTIYCKEFYVSSLPNTGAADTAINASQNVIKVVGLRIFAGSDSWGWAEVNFYNYIMGYILGGTTPPLQYIRLETTANRTSEAAKVRIWYTFA